MEAFVASLAGLLGIFTWTHEQRQRVTDKRFENIKKRLELVEEKIEKLPIDYVLKKDLNNDLHEIQIGRASCRERV